MGRDEYEILTGSGYFWRIGVKFRRKFGVESCKRSLEYCALKDFFGGLTLLNMYDVFPNLGSAQAIVTSILFSDRSSSTTSSHSPIY